MTQKMDIKHVYDLDDLKKFKESGASVEEVRKAYVMMAENKERREKATKELVNLGWKEFLLGRVKDLVEQGADVNAKDKYGRTPLYVASEEGHIDVVKYFVELGADVEAKDRFGKTPLHVASRNGHIDVVKYLVEHGADMEAKDEDGRTPLHLASWNGYIGVVKYLVEHGADVMAKSKDGNTPLHEASEEEGHIDVVKYLLEHGADVKVKDKNGGTSLNWASRGSSIVRHLREMKKLSLQRSKKAKEIRSIDVDWVGRSVDHSLRRMLFGGKQLRQDAPLSPIVAERFRKRQDRS